MVERRNRNERRWQMPIDKSASHEEIVQELMHAYEENGKISNGLGYRFRDS